MHPGQWRKSKLAFTAADHRSCFVGLFVDQFYLGSWYYGAIGINDRSANGPVFVCALAIDGNRRSRVSIVIFTAFEFKMFSLPIVWWELQKNGSRLFYGFDINS